MLVNKCKRTTLNEIETWKKAIVRLFFYFPPKKAYKFFPPLQTHHTWILCFDDMHIVVMRNVRDRLTRVERSMGKSKSWSGWESEVKKGPREGEVVTG